MGVRKRAQVGYFHRRLPDRSGPKSRSLRRVSVTHARGSARCCCVSRSVAAPVTGATKVAPYTTKAPDGLKREAAKLGTAVGEFAERLFEGDHPRSKIRQGHKLLRLGDRYTAQRPDAACRRALDVDLIDDYRVENILVQALEEETTLQLPLPLPPGRFARPGSVFAQSDPYRRKSA